jgi:hypothetical protein
VFVPAGEQSIAFMKGYRERGLAEAGIKVIATGDLTDDHVLPAMGDATLGVITTFHYSAAHKSPENGLPEELCGGQPERRPSQLHGGGRLRRHGGHL